MSTSFGIFDPAGVAFHPFVRGWALADLVDAAVRGDGDLDAVRGYLAKWERVAMETRAPHLEVQVAYAAAILAPDAVAEKHFRAAIASGQAEWPFYVARAQLAYGVWLRRHRRMTQSRAPLREAAETFDALGLLRYAERARRELRASGERVRRRVAGGWAQLSPQELQIAKLAAGRPLEPGNRRAALSLSPNRRVAPVSALPEARRHLSRTVARRARGRSALLTKCSEST